jgi:ankyrin repeat protein
VVDTLLRAGAEADAMNHEGTTPLHEAAYNGHADVIRMLLDAGANADGTPPLGAEIALASKSLTAALRLNCGALFGCGGAGAAAAAERDDGGGAGKGGGARGERGARGAAGGSTPLHWAVRRAAVAGSVEAVGLLLAAGACVDAADGTGETPLHKAAHNGDAEVCERLLEAGASLEARNRTGGTPLRSAAAAGQVVTCMVLLSAGADMGDGASGVGGSVGSSAIAAAVGDAAALLSHVRGWCATAAEALPDEQRGWLLRTRALQKAAVRVMVMQKAALDGHMSDADFDAAAAATTDAVVAEAHLKSLLSGMGAGTVSKATALDVAANAVASLDEETAAALRVAFPALFAAGGATPPWGAAAAAPPPPSAGATPLHRAAAAGDADKLLTLLGTGASADVRDAAGRTPLHAAAAGGSAQACKVLLAGGASLDAWYQARPAYAPKERVSALVYGTAALFRGGTPLDVAVGDAVAVLREATQREAARASRVQAPSAASSHSRYAGGMSAVPNGVRALSRQGSGAGSRASGGTASPASFGGSGGGPPRMGGTAEEAIAAAEADALAAAEAAALAMEAEMDADAAATEDPSAANIAAAAAAARWARDRAAAAAAAQMTLSEARMRVGPRAHDLLPHANAHRRASLAGTVPM